MKPFNAALGKMRAICLCLPDSKETPTWGQPHFRVGEKIFAGLGEQNGVLTATFKLEMDHADAMVLRPGFSRAPYVGHRGWVSADIGRVTDWDELGALIQESYRLIAPKKTLAKWQGEPLAKTPAASAGKAREAARSASPPKKKRPSRRA